MKPHKSRTSRGRKDFERAGVFALVGISPREDHTAVAASTSKHSFRSLALLLFFGLVLVAAGPAAAQTWVELNPVGAPSSDRFHGFFGKTVGYDGASNRLIVFLPRSVGFGGEGFPAGLTGEVWVLKNANGLGGTPEWEQLQTTGTAPGIHTDSTAVYDSGGNRLIVYGGGFYHTSPVLNGVFVLTNANGLGGPAVWSQAVATNAPCFGFLGQPGACIGDHGRMEHTAIYNPDTNQMIAFGGHLAFFGTSQNDLRFLTNANQLGGSPSSWITAETAAGPPPIRSAHGVIYDDSSARMVLYAGELLQKNFCCGIPSGNIHSDYGDLWVLENANGVGGTPTWSLQTPLGPTPPNRSYHSAVYDLAHNRMLVYGGRRVVDFVAQRLSTLSDLWELHNANGIGGTPEWVQLTPSGTGPGPLLGHAAVLDSVNQRMIVFAGSNPSGFIGPRVWVLVLNLAPTADAGGDQTLDCASVSATPVTLDGSGSSDPDDDALTYTWTGPFPEGGGTVTGVNPTVTLPLGTHTITLTVDDGKGGSASDTVTITVQDTTPPVLALATDSVTVVVPIASATGATVDLSGIASATDVCDPSVTITNNVPALFSIGLTTVTFTASDDSGNFSQKQLTVQVVYRFTGFLQPINNDGSSIFKSGRTIPIKFRLTAADGSLVTNATGTLQIFKITDVVLGTVEEVTPEAPGASNLDNLFRLDPTSGQYIYNLTTTGYSPGTYLLRVRLNDQTTHEVQVSIR